MQIIKGGLKGMQWVRMGCLCTYLLLLQLPPSAKKKGGERKGISGNSKTKAKTKGRD